MDSPAEEWRHQMDEIGTFHVGEHINKFRKGTNKQNKTKQNNTIQYKSNGKINKHGCETIKQTNRC